MHNKDCIALEWPIRESCADYELLTAISHGTQTPCGQNSRLLTV